jgi:CRP-like cAMP-binding protein
VASSVRRTIYCEPNRSFMMRKCRWPRLGCSQDSTAAAVIFRESEVGNEVLIITKGIASAYLQIPNTNIRLATFASGTIFGELAILDEGVRSATVVADTELVCRTLTTSNFAALSAKSPSIAIRLLAAIARELSGRLRTANRTIHQLDT